MTTPTPLEEDFADLIRLCDRLLTALERRDERASYGYMEAVRSLGIAVLNRDAWARLNEPQIFIQAAMDNGLWEMAWNDGVRLRGMVRQAIEASHVAN